jgi:hypothetical protein
MEKCKGLVLPLIACLLLAAFLGCVTQKKEGLETPAPKEVQTMEISLTSKGFEDGKSIPMKYTCDGEDLSPPLSWGDLPEETKSLALIVDDPDAPMGTFTHWVLFNIPPDARSLPEGIPQREILETGGTQGKNDFKKIGYNGPCPPPGPAHTYRFRLYALDLELDLDPGASKRDVLKAMEGHVLAEAELKGKYGR